MGKDKHFSVQANEITHSGKKFPFTWSSSDYHRIIGLPYQQRYDQYSVTKEYIFLDIVKLPLHDDGEYIYQNTVQVRKIDVPVKEGEVWNENQNMIHDGIYTIKILKFGYQYIITEVSFNRYQY